MCAPKKSWQRVAGITLALLSSSFCALSIAAGWPSQPITMVVPFPAGGGADTLARLVAAPLGQHLGQSVIIDNRAGAGGSVGMAIASRAHPDGYTLAYGTNGTMGTNHWLYKNVGYKPGDFEPISRMTIIALAMVVKSDAPYKSLKDLLAYAKAHPNELTCASGGNGTSSHLACEQLKQMAGVQILHVPYKGGAPALVDLRGGRVTFIIDVVPNLMGQVKDGSLRALGVTTTKRIDTFPNVPTFSESGIAGYEFFAWDGLFAPKGTPTAVLDRLNAEAKKVLESPEVKKGLIDRGAIPSPTTRKEFADFAQSEYQRLGRIVTAAGVKID